MNGLCRLRKSAIPRHIRSAQDLSQNGFDGTKWYEVGYGADDPVVLGVGHAAIRDIPSFFRCAHADDAGTPNP